MLPDHQTLPDDPAGSQQIAALHQQYEQQLVQLNDENRLLREQIAHFADRVKVLERIVTDKGTLVAAEIEALRDTPRKEISQ